MRRSTVPLMLLALVLAHARPVAAKKYRSAPDRGNSTLQAVFGAQFGERINAISSATGAFEVYAFAVAGE